MKGLNIIEASNMPVGTRFKVIFEDGSKCNNIVSFDNCKFYQNDFVRDSIHVVYINAKFIPIPKPVSFMEVVSSDKRCRVEHKYVDVIKARTNQQSLYIADFRNDNYIPLNYLMNILGYSSSAENIRQIINEGKWYIED